MPCFISSPCYLPMPGRSLQAKEKSPLFISYNPPENALPFIESRLLVGAKTWLWLSPALRLGYAVSPAALTELPPKGYVLLLTSRSPDDYPRFRKLLTLSPKARKLLHVHLQAKQALAT